MTLVSGSDPQPIYQGPYLILIREQVFRQKIDAWTFEPSGQHHDVSVEHNFFPLIPWFGASFPLVDFNSIASQAASISTNVFCLSLTDKFQEIIIYYLIVMLYFQLELKGLGHTGVPSKIPLSHGARSFKLP